MRRLLIEWNAGSSLVAINALSVRAAGGGMVKTSSAGSMGGGISYADPSLEPNAGETYGVILYRGRLCR